MNIRKKLSGEIKGIVWACALVSFFLAGAGNGALAPEEAIAKLKDGHKRYVAEKPVRPNQTQARRKETTGGQHPFVSILSCSDSRVPLEIIFDQGIGDIFAVRVAGNVVDTIGLGSLEYGVAYLNTPVVLVLGHTHCGAVSAAATNASVQGSISPLVEKIVPAVYAAKEKDPKLTGDKLITRATEENVWQAMEDLISRSSIIRQELMSGKIQVIGAIFNIEDGQINWLGSHPNQVRLLQFHQPENLNP